MKESPAQKRSAAITSVCRLALPALLALAGCAGAPPGRSGHGRRRVDPEQRGRRHDRRLSCDLGGSAACRPRCRRSCATSLNAMRHRPGSTRSYAESRRRRRTTRTSCSSGSQQLEDVARPDALRRADRDTYVQVVSRLPALPAVCSTDVGAKSSQAEAAPRSPVSTSRVNEAAAGVCRRVGQRRSSTSRSTRAYDPGASGPGRAGGDGGRSLAAGRRPTRESASGDAAARTSYAALPDRAALRLTASTLPVVEDPAARAGSTWSR